MPYWLNGSILENRQNIIETESYFLDGSDIVVIAYGFTARACLYGVKRVRKEGLKVGFLRLKTIWPFPEEAVREATAGATKVFIPEMNRGQVAGEVKKYVSCEVISLGQTNGEVIRPETLIEMLRKIS